jgi:hypothetical protein
LEEAKQDILGSIVFDRTYEGEPFAIYNDMEIYEKIKKWFGSVEKA